MSRYEPAATRSSGQNTDPAAEFVLPVDPGWSRHLPGDSASPYWLAAVELKSAPAEDGKCPDIASTRRRQERCERNAWAGATYADMQPGRQLVGRRRPNR